jgi:hypothetical protein
MVKISTGPLKLIVSFPLRLKHRAMDQRLLQLFLSYSGKLPSNKEINLQSILNVAAKLSPGHGHNT